LTSDEDASGERERDDDDVVELAHAELLCNKCNLQSRHVLYLVPMHTGVPWYVRVKYLVELCEQHHSTETTMSLAAH
jgi:hypothetical protein